MRPGTIANSRCIYYRCPLQNSGRGGLTFAGEGGILRVRWNQRVVLLTGCLPAVAVADFASYSTILGHSHSAFQTTRASNSVCIGVVIIG